MIRQIARSSTPTYRGFVAPWEPPPHLQILQDHLCLLDQYDSLAEYFIPSDERLLRPTLALRDSNQGSIFLSREALERDGTIENSAVIDWQHVAVLTCIPQQPYQGSSRKLSLLLNRLKIFSKGAGVFASSVPCALPGTQFRYGMGFFSFL